MTAPVTIVMAGGLGTRMRSPRPKVLHDLCGRTMLEWVVAAAREAGAEDVVAVVSPDIAAPVAAAVPGIRVAVQDRPLGTADAVRTGLAVVPNGATEVLVLSGDTPTIHPRTVRAVADARRARSAEVALVTTRAEPPHAYGRVVRRHDGSVARIVEAADATPEELAVDEINAGLYCFSAAPLAEAIAGLETHNAQGELYLTDAVGVLAAAGGAVAVEEADRQSCEGVNTMIELSDREAELRRRLCDQAMLAGVRIVDPATTFLEPGVRLEPGSRIEPFTTLRGATSVAEGAVVGPHVVAVDAEIGPGCVVGPFALLRPGTVLAAEAQVGRFVELKNTHLGRGAKVPHLSYLGDAEVGDESNIGAGNITANYDGARKHRTTIGARVHTSCDTVFVAPVTIGDDAYTGAGSVITDDVPPGALGIARSRQTTIEGYGKRAPGRGAPDG
jgi:bifunctional UDP-N-acetylglucosamine pyrophosphorylase/glucosamine-1-phosphate N-acetyltransferase